MCYVLWWVWRKKNYGKNKNSCLIFHSSLSKAIYIQIDYDNETHCFNSFAILRHLCSTDCMSTYKDIKVRNAFWIYWYKMHYINYINPLIYWSAFTREGKLIFNVTQDDTYSELLTTPTNFVFLLGHLQQNMHTFRNGFAQLVAILMILSKWWHPMIRSVLLVCPEDETKYFGSDENWVG